MTLMLQTNFSIDKYKILWYDIKKQVRRNVMINDGIAKTENEITSFLMIGQSNMAGRGEFGEVEPINSEDCFMLRMGRWQRMSEPVNPDRAVFESDFHSGISLGASFADSYAKHFGKKTGLIPCADGGTKLSQWMPGEILFDHAVFMAKTAMRTSSFGGILWHQGESDCNAADIASYKERFIFMISELRKALDAEQLPLLIGELSPDIQPKWNCGDYPEKMNRIFKEIEKEIAFCRVVPSNELSLKKDGIHFDSKSLRTFGHRYFDAYLNVINNA